MRKRVFTQEEIDTVIYNYTVLHMGQKRAGAAFHMNDALVKRLLIENGIHVKTIKETNISRYSINLDFFKTQSAELAYFLGLLAADGCIASNENCIYIELQDSDSDLLEQINTIIGNERPIKHYVTAKGYKNCKLYFFSAEIKEILKTYGLVPNKTYSADFKFPYKLAKEYWKDYLRGYFDGDGCIKKTNNTLTFQIDGANLPILQEFRNFLQEDYGISTQFYTDLPEDNERQTIKKYRIYAYSSNAEKIFGVMYSNNDCIKLRRKFERFLTYKK